MLLMMVMLVKTNIVVMTNMVMEKMGMIVMIKME